MLIFLVVGGGVLDLAFSRAKPHARFVICGGMSASFPFLLTAILNSSSHQPVQLHRPARPEGNCSFLFVLSLHIFRPVIFVLITFSATVPITCPLTCLTFSICQTLTIIPLELRNGNRHANPRPRFHRLRLRITVRLCSKRARTVAVRGQDQALGDDYQRGIGPG